MGGDIENVVDTGWKGTMDAADMLTGGMASKTDETWNSMNDTERAALVAALATGGAGSAGYLSGVGAGIPGAGGMLGNAAIGAGKFAGSVGATELARQAMFPTQPTAMKVGGSKPMTVGGPGNPTGHNGGLLGQAASQQNPYTTQAPLGGGFQTGMRRF
jgi:hypothetical protein